MDLFHIFSSESGRRLGTARVTIHFLLYAKERLVLVLWREVCRKRRWVSRISFFGKLSSSYPDEQTEQTEQTRTWSQSAGRNVFYKALNVFLMCAYCVHF